MTFTPAIWYRIAVVLTLINLVGGGFALGAAEPGHAATHGVLVLAFGFWARRLRQAPGGTERERESEIESESAARLEALDAEVSNLRRELNETQERLDFAERMLARGPDPRRADPQR